MITLTVDSPESHRVLIEAPGAFAAHAHGTPFGFTGSVSFLEIEQAQDALKRIRADQMIGAPHD